MDTPRASEFGPFLTLGIQLALGVVAFFFLGKWLDSLFATEPWLMIAGLVLGSGGGLFKFIRTALVMGKKADQDAREKE